VKGERERARTRGMEGEIEKGKMIERGNRERKNDRNEKLRKRERRKVAYTYACHKALTKLSRLLEQS
jgi:hypothetical protein